MKKLTTEMDVRGKQFGRRKSTGQQVRVLGVVEGYVVARVKGCGPFLYGWRDFEKDFERLFIADTERPKEKLTSGMVCETDKAEYFRLYAWRDRWQKLLRSNRYELSSDIERIERRCKIANANIGAWLRRVHGDRLKF